jgi:hypothetical protein
VTRVKMKKKKPEHILFTISKLEDVPRRHKDVLHNWATFGDPDGTNIFPEKDSVAKRAGVSRWTVYRNTKDLIEAGALVDTGEKHYWPGGHWTTVYRIDVSMLQNKTLLGEKLRSKMLLEKCESHVAKCNKPCSKMPKSHVAKCDATYPLDLLPPLATNERASERVNEESAAPQPPIGVPVLDEVREMLQHLGVDVNETEIDAASQVLKVLSVGEVLSYWTWNRTNKKGERLFTSMTTVLKTVLSDNPRSGLRQWRTWCAANQPPAVSQEAEAVCTCPFESCQVHKPAFEVEEDFG